MRISIAKALSALLVLQLTGAEPAAACNKNNECYSAVSANAVAPSSVRKAGCASFLKTTFTPKPSTTTYTQLVTTTFCPTKYTTETPKETRTRTATRTATSTATTTQTNFITTSVTSTVRTDTTTTVTDTNTITETTSTTVYVTTTIGARKRDVQARAGCPTTSAGPSTLPTYASVCQNTDAYSSACSCYGATPASTTIKACTNTVTKQSTKTRTVPASTITRTAPSPVTTETKTNTITKTKTIQENNTSTFSTDTTVFTSTSTSRVVTDTTTTTTAVTTETVTISPGSYNCSKYGYIVAIDTLYQIDLSTGEIDQITDTVNDAGHAVNAMGYNALDNFLYAVQDDGVIIKILSDGTSQPIGNLGSYANVGAVDLDGFLWVAYGTPWWKIDVRPTSNTYGQVVDQGNLDSLGYDLIDWVFLPTHPGYLYSIAGTATALLRFSMTTHVIDVVTTFGGATPQADWPFNFATLDTIYAITGSGNTGEIWAFNVEQGTSQFFGQGPANDGRGDGARCVLNPNVST